MMFLEQRERTQMMNACCSDCGSVGGTVTQHFDRHTCSTVTLCANCVPAFLQRQQIVLECCGDQ